MSDIAKSLRNMDKLLVTFKVEPRLVRQLPLTPRSKQSHKNDPTELLSHHEHLNLQDLPLGLPEARLHLFRACKKTFSDTGLSVHANFYWFFRRDTDATPPNPQLIEAAHLFTQLCNARHYNFKLYTGDFPRTYRMYCS